MNQDKLNEIIDLENKFKKLADVGHPNVIDNGFFLDAIFNVTEVLKREQKDNQVNTVFNEVEYNEKLQVINNLYRSLKSFEMLYTNCLGGENQG